MTEMRVPLVDLGAQYRTIRAEIDAAIQRVIDSTRFILGPEVGDFERTFSAYVGAAETVGVASGTAALELALRACGVGPGDEVITTAHTFIATVEPIVKVGAVPVLVDIEADSFNIDPECVERAITARTRAIVPVHLYGRPAEMGALCDIARRHRLRVIEDAAQAHGATYNGRVCGSLGDLACFSFFPGKNLGAYGDAGAVTGSDPELTATVRLLRDHGRVSKYEHEVMGQGERLDALQAAILAVKMTHLADWTAARRRVAERYDRLLAGTPAITPTAPVNGASVYHLYVIRVPRRDEVLRHLRAAGVEAGVHYPVPVHRQEAYRKLGLPIPTLPETDRAAAEVLSLPIYPEIRDDQIDFVVERLRELL
jgi:dTDP-4-amino-4,6-dideoxygalactose transaminase